MITATLYVIQWFFWGNKEYSYWRNSFGYVKLLDSVSNSLLKEQGAIWNKRTAAHKCSEIFQ